MTATQTARVLIVGAGPTGLTLAMILSRYGVPCRIIEKRVHPSRSTRATNLMQRSQEVLHALGVLEPIATLGGQMSRMMVHAYGKCYGPRTMHLKETPFPNVLLCGQHNFEAVMAQALERSGACIEFGTELVSLQQDKDGVSAGLKSPEGPEHARFDYVAGCDGANGITRTFTRHNFETIKTGVALRQADCKLTWRRLSTLDQLWLFYFQNGFATVVPLPGGLHRVIMVEPKAAIPERKPALEELEAKLREVTLDPSLTLSDADWFSYTDLSMGIASGLRDGRVLLAGDVGNPILPNGGQGMNTGISDAFNLGWKLASVLQAGGPSALLDTYAQERLSLRESLQKAQYSSLKYTTLVTPKAAQALMSGLAEPLLNRGGEYKMAQAFSQLSVNTRKSLLTLERAGNRGLRAGDRALDADVVLGTKSVRLYDFIYAGGWTLLAFTGTAAVSADLVAEAIGTLDCASLPCYLVSTGSAAAALPALYDLELYDLDETAHRVYAVIKPTLLLIRPDGYVGARVPPRESRRLKDYIAKWLPSGGPNLAPDTPFRPTRV